jgi:hypothetical protein
MEHMIMYLEVLTHRKNYIFRIEVIRICWRDIYGTVQTAFFTADLLTVDETESKEQMDK